MPPFEEFGDGAPARDQVSASSMKRVPGTGLA